MRSRPSILYVIGIAALLVGAVAWIRVLGPHRPYVDWDPIELAQYIVDHQRSPEECWDLIVLDFLGPQPAVKRSSCVFQVAQLTLNSSVCESLLPSEYALACLSEVGGKLFDDRSCHEFLGEEGLYCREESSAELVVKKPQIRDCSLYKRADVIEWCHYTRTYTLPGVYECNKIPSPEVRDDCERGYAFKQKNPSLCSAVKDEKRRKYCEIRINVWLQYPELRTSSYFGE